MISMVNKACADSVAAAIVTYNPDIEMLDANIRAIYGRVRLFIIDNGSANVRDIENLLADINRETIYLIKNSKNMGIAVALNQALGASRAANYRWLLTLDQDSLCDRDFFDHILPVIQTCHSDVGIIYPTIIDEAIESITNRKDRGACVNALKRLKSSLCRLLGADITLPITSGSVVNTDIAARIGNFYEDLFIDGVDHDFALKIYEGGYSIIKCEGAMLYQNQGAPVTRKVAGNTFAASGHSPLRCYYMNRNSWLLFYRHRAEFLGWTIYNIISTFTSTLLNVAVNENHLEYLKEIAKGELDGIMGKSGKRK